MKWKKLKNIGIVRLILCKGNCIFLYLIYFIFKIKYYLKLIIYFNTYINYC